MDVSLSEIILQSKDLKSLEREYISMYPGYQSQRQYIFLIFLLFFGSVTQVNLDVAFLSTYFYEKLDVPYSSYRTTWASPVRNHPGGGPISFVRDVRFAHVVW